MTFAVSIFYAFAIGLGAWLAIILYQLFSQSRQLPVTAEWIGELSAERYHPMLRLMDANDLRFLRSQPGFDRRMESRLRTQRCQIFRGYLFCLEREFQLTCSALKLLMTQSAHDRSDLASTLMEAQVRFAFGLTALQLRVVLYRLGLANVDARAVLRVFDGMRVELRALMPVMDGAAA